MDEQMDREWLNGLLVDKRAIGNHNHGLLDAIARGDYILLAPNMAIAHEEYDALNYREQRYLKTMAAGRNAHKAVLVGRSAAIAAGMWVVNLTAYAVELSLPSGHRPARSRWPAGTVYRRSTPGPTDICHGRWVRMTSPVRTFIDIARFHGFAEGLIAADWLLRQGFTKNDLRAAVKRAGRMKNADTVRKCIEYAVDNSGSAYESLARARLIEAGLGEVVTQYRVKGFYVDLAFPDSSVGVEVDGDSKYGAGGAGTKQTVVAELKRQKAIENTGMKLLRYSPNTIRDRPAEFVAEVRAALEKAERWRSAS